MNESMMRMAILLGTAAVAFLVSWLSGRYFVPMLHRLKFGQTIRDVGPAWHKNKQGTPTMGGVMFIVGFLVAMIAAVLVCEAATPLKPLSGVAFTERVRLISGIVMALACGAIGFADDYIKVVKKRNLGLTSLQKIILQLIVGAGYAAIMYFLGEGSVIYVPFVGETDIGWWYLPLCIFFTVGFSNATNLTDGVDGLCGSITVVASCCMMIAATVTAHFGQSLVAIAFAGALVGFLMWNLHPAKVFMGDTGSLLIGGVLCALAFGIGRPFLLLPFGIMYIVETLSVMLQVSYFKLTHGKRLFKMSPIHHHFEMCGWSENKIVTVFSSITAVAGIAAIAAMVLTT
ncbi:MAG: phospho-N-acetylmuramoyl-pentapeptide-transferase [Ruminococcaceae bacterium]|nr:phospho-N-acetylmuramoyl-pentapeptide-transferase [Oscillospiraceae bacterium]